MVSGSDGGTTTFEVADGEAALGLDCTANACGNVYTGPDGLTHQAVDLPMF